MNGKSNIGKFDSRSDEGIFLGYSDRSKAYRVFNKRTLVVEESIHVKFVEQRVPRDDHTSITHKSDELAVQSAATNEKNGKLISLDDEQKVQTANDTEHLTLPCSWRFEKDHPPANILGTIDEGV